MAASLIPEAVITVSPAQKKAYEEIAQYFGAIVRTLMITSGDVKDTARLAFHFARLAGR